jgi:hypothetical protein
MRYLRLYIGQLGLGRLPAEAPVGVLGPRPTLVATKIVGDADQNPVDLDYIKNQRIDQIVEDDLVAHFNFH